jgi:hypothetical protein
MQQGGIFEVNGMPKGHGQISPFKDRQQLAVDMALAGPGASEYQAWQDSAQPYIQGPMEYGVKANPLSSKGTR